MNARGEYLGLLALVALLVGAAAGANVLVVLAGDEGGSSPVTDEYDTYWTPGNGDTPFLNVDQTGSSFTRVLHDPFSSSSVLSQPIDSQFDMVVYFKSGDSWEDEPLRSEWAQNLIDFANRGKVVLVTGSDVLRRENSLDTFLCNLVGGSSAFDADFYDSRDGFLGDFSSDVACEPMLDGPFGTLYGTTPDTSFATGYRGLNFTNFLAADSATDAAIPCLQPVRVYADYLPYGGGGFDTFALYSVRPMFRGGVIAYMSVSDDGYEILVNGFCSTIINNLFSYATLAGVGGDPHVVGFDKSSLDLLGASGDVYNLISDEDLQVNARLWTPEGAVGQTYRSFMGALAFLTAAGDAIVVEAGASGVAASVTINGEILALEEVESLDAASFHLERTLVAPKVPMMLGSAFGSEPTDALVLRFDRYAFEIYVVRVEGNAAQLYFVDFEVSLLSQGHTPHGVVGRTLMVNGARQVRDEELGSQEDFLVHDGLLGSDFVFNRF